MDFMVVGSMENKTNAKIILFVNNDNSWIRITVTYIITSRNDLFIGSFAALGSLLNQTGKTYSYEYCIKNWTQPKTKITSVAVLSGFRTSVFLIPQIKVNSGKINIKTGIITIKLTIKLKTPI